MNNIVIKNLTKSYSKEDRVILNKINVCFEEGKIYAILGKSGSGKTTLLNILSGLDQEYNGNVYINSLDLRNILDLDEKSYLHNYVSYIHQSSTCFEKLSIFDNVKIPYISSLPSLVSLSEYGIKHDGKKKVYKLSKGEQKRINIIQNIYKESKLILLDEPTSSLDNENAINIMNKIKDLSSNKIIIMVTHNKELAEKYADEIIEIVDGKIAKQEKRKIKSSELKIKNAQNVRNKDAKRCAKKFVKSEKKNNNLIISAALVVLSLVGLLSSLVFGCQKFFKDQINETDELTTLTLKTNNTFTSLSSSEYEELETLYPNQELFKYYQTNQLIDCSIGYVELSLPSTFIDLPNKYVENLNDDEIILSVSEEFKEELENYFEVDDIEDYLLFNELEFSFIVNDNEFSYKIKEFFLSEDEEFYINSSNKKLYLDFHDTSEACYYGFYNSNLDSSFESFINTTTNYIFEENDKLVTIYKSNNYFIDYKILENNYNILPLYENNDAYWINYLENVLYFKNTKFEYDSEEINSSIFYSPYYKKLLKGRYVENNDEIVISLALFNKLNMKLLQEDIYITYNNVTKPYKIVGVSDEKNSLYIYQDFSWALDEFTASYLSDSFLFKPTNYLLLTKPSESIKLCEELNNKYPTYIANSYVGETLNNLNNVLSKITIISICIITLLSIFSIISLILLFILEKENYSNQIRIMNGFGYDYKDLNKIYSKITLDRFLITSILASLFCFIEIKLTNYIFIHENIFEEEILSNNPFIYLLIFALSLLIFNFSYIFVRFHKRKALADIAKA